MKQQLLQDLHKLYSVPFSDCFDTNEALMRLLMARHALCFKPRQEVAASIYWREGADVASKFFDEICPGPLLSEAAFCRVCEDYLDFAIWQQQLPAASPMPHCADLFSPPGLKMAPAA